MKKRPHDGFSMIEALISIFVLALGVIGVAAMQLHALRTSQNSAFQTTALQLASEMADRMRAGRMNPAAGNPYLQVDYPGTHIAPDKLCFANDCNAAELARFEIHEWEERVGAALPGGRAVICRDASPWDAGQGALTWTCNPGAGDGTPVVIKLGWRAKGTDPDGSAVADATEPFPPSVAITVQPHLR